MSRKAIVAAAFAALAAGFMAAPANAYTATPGNLAAGVKAGSSEIVQNASHHRNFRRGHGNGIRLFFGGGRHQRNWGNHGGWRRNFGNQGHRRGYGSGYGRGRNHDYR